MLKAYNKFEIIRIVSQNTCTDLKYDYDNRTNHTITGINFKKSISLTRLLSFALTLSLLQQVSCNIKLVVISGKIHHRETNNRKKYFSNIKIFVM